MNAIKDVLSKWWLVLILGIINLAIGIWFLSTVGAGFMLTKICLEIDFLTLGIVSVAVIIINRNLIPAWGWDLAAALVVLAMGVVLICIPELSDAVLCTLYALGMIAEGAACLKGYFTLKKIGGLFKGLIFVLILGIIAVVTGVLLLFYPQASFMSIDVLTSSSIFATGIALLILAFNMSKTNSAVKQVEKAVEEEIEAVKNEVKAAEEEIRKAVDEKLNGPDDAAKEDQ